MDLILGNFEFKRLKNDTNFNSENFDVYYHDIGEYTKVCVTRRKGSNITRFDLFIYEDSKAVIELGEYKSIADINRLINTLKSFTNNEIKT